MPRRAFETSACIMLLGALMALAGGCEPRPELKPVEEPLEREDALRADEEMRRSANELLEEHRQDPP